MKSHLVWLAMTVVLTVIGAIPNILVRLVSLFIVSFVMGAVLAIRVEAETLEERRLATVLQMPPHD
mgnify:CR=1 FL=1